MPLSKLWNSIRGRSKHSPPIEKREVSKQGVAEEPKKKAPKANRKKSGPGFSLFGGGPHAGLCKLVKSSLKPSEACLTTSGSASRTVLEISVEDGSRALDVLKTLARMQEENVRYLAIDPFELAEGGTTLKEFHQTLRAENIRPQVFPGTIPHGLIRVAHTVGSVDLVVIAAAAASWRTPAILPLLSRISHENTIVLYREDGSETWNRLEAASHRCESGRRRAA